MRKGRKGRKVISKRFCLFCHFCPSCLPVRFSHLNDSSRRPNAFSLIAHYGRPNHFTLWCGDAVTHLDFQGRATGVQRSFGYGHERKPCRFSLVSSLSLQGGAPVLGPARPNTSRVFVYASVTHHDEDYRPSEIGSGSPTRGCFD